MSTPVVHSKKKKHTGPLPVSNVSKILLHDNQLETLVLEQSLSRINKDQRRSQRLLDMQKQTFIVNQACKEQELRDMGIPHVPFLPEIVMKQTEPDVKSRRVLAKPKKSASYLAKDLEKTSLLPMGIDFLNGDKNGGTERFTHLHGINWLPDSDESTLREREIMRKLNDMEASMKSVDDPRFVKLEKSLVRKDKSLWEILGEEHSDSRAVEGVNDKVRENTQQQQGLTNGVE
ncbi:uncharacterized protein LOC144434599 [Glandiceps talaboti]